MNHGYNIHEWRENLSDMKLNLELSSDMNLNKTKTVPPTTSNLMLEDSLTDLELATLLQSNEEVQSGSEQEQLTDEFIKMKGDQIKKESILRENDEFVQI